MDSNLLVTAMIDNHIYKLPSEAKYYFQSPTGVWYWLDSKPYKMVQEKSNGKVVDWTPQKKPIQIKTLDGFDRVLVTETPPEEDGWLNTLQTVHLQAV